MKINKRLLFICVSIPLIVGIVAGLLTQNSMELFQTLEKHTLSPPGWLFPIVWTILYALMGVSSYLILTADAGKEEIEQAIRLYSYQLVVNFLWSTFFFHFGWYLFSFLWIILLWILIFQMIRIFYEINKVAAYLNIPYLIWVTFAGYLNLSIWLLNR